MTCLGATFVVCASVLAGFILWLRFTERTELRRNDLATKELAALKSLPVELKAQVSEVDMRVRRLEAIRVTR